MNVSCDGISCKDALRLAYDQFGLPYIIIGKNIIIGGVRGMGVNNLLEYGKGKGLYELEKNTDDTQQVVTKMYAYGSSENIPLNYYANIGRTAIYRRTEPALASNHVNILRVKYNHPQYIAFVLNSMVICL